MAVNVLVAVAVWCCALRGEEPRGYWKLVPDSPNSEAFHREWVDQPEQKDTRPHKYPIKALCPMCGGDGTLADHATGKTHPCGECHGTGERPVYPWEKRIPCEACKAAGHIGGVECEECAGLGWTPKYELKSRDNPEVPREPDDVTARFYTKGGHGWWCAFKTPNGFEGVIWIGEPEGTPEPPRPWTKKDLAGAEEESFGAIGDGPIGRWIKNRPRPIQTVVKKVEIAGERMAQGFIWCAVVAVAVPALLVVAAFLSLMGRRRQSTVIQVVSSPDKKGTP